MATAFAIVSGVAVGSCFTSSAIVPRLYHVLLLMCQRLIDESRFPVQLRQTSLDGCPVLRRTKVGVVLLVNCLLLQQHRLNHGLHNTFASAEHHIPLTV